jgi:hypothetical protein
MPDSQRELALELPEAQYIAELKQAAMVLQERLNGALTLIVRQRKLQGSWALSPDGLKVICTDPEKTDGME